MSTDPLFRPADIPDDWRYFEGRFQLGHWVFSFQDWLPQWAWERIQPGIEPAQRRPGALCAALRKCGLSVDGAIALAGMTDELQRTWAGCHPEDMKRIEDRAAKAAARTNRYTDAR